MTETIRIATTVSITEANNTLTILVRIDFKKNPFPDNTRVILEQKHLNYIKNRGKPQNYLHFNAKRSTP